MKVKNGPVVGILDSDLFLNLDVSECSYTYNVRCKTLLRLPSSFSLFDNSQESAYAIDLKTGKYVNLSGIQLKPSIQKASLFSGMKQNPNFSDLDDKRIVLLDAFLETILIVVLDWYDTSRDRPSRCSLYSTFSEGFYSCGHLKYVSFDIDNTGATILDIYDFKNDLKHSIRLDLCNVAISEVFGAVYYLDSIYIFLGAYLPKSREVRTLLLIYNLASRRVKSFIINYALHSCKFLVVDRGFFITSKKRIYFFSAEEEDLVLIPRALFDYSIAVFSTYSYRDAGVITLRESECKGFAAFYIGEYSKNYQYLSLKKEHCILFCSNPLRAMVNRPEGVYNPSALLVLDPCFYTGRFVFPRVPRYKFDKFPLSYTHNIEVTVSQPKVCDTLEI